MLYNFLQKGKGVLINIAIIGTGGISTAHVKAYQALSEACNIVALADIIQTKQHLLQKDLHWIVKL